MCLLLAQIQLQLDEICVSFRGVVYGAAGDVDVVVGCPTRVPSAWKLGDRLWSTGHPAAQQLRKALRCLSFDLRSLIDVLLLELIRA